MHSKLPWRIVEATPKKSAEIVDANGSTVARLTALDMDNARLIVRAVNATQDTEGTSCEVLKTSN